MLKTLLKIRFAAYLAGFTGASRQKKRQSGGKTALFLLLMVYCFGAFVMMFYSFFSQMAGPFYEAGLAWLYFAFFGLTAFALMFIGSVFTAKAQLFEARDNELLLSMPIRPRDILGSRMAALMLMNLLFELLVAIPALAAWFGSAPLGASGLASFVVLVLALPFLAMAATSLVAWLVSLLTARVRNKSLMTMLFSLLFLGAYFYFFSKINQYIAQLISNGALIAGRLGAIAPIYWLGDAVANGNFVSLLYLVLLCAAAFALLYYLLSRSFIHILTTKRGFAKIRYQEKALRVSSPTAALLRRELVRLGSSPTFMLNAGLGLVFIVCAAVALVVVRSRIALTLFRFGVSGGAVAVVAALGACLLSGMVLFTAPSVSLEGKTLWILRSLPVETYELLRAKLRMSFRLLAPCMLLFSAAAIWAARPDPLSAVGLLLVPLLFSALSGNLGLIENLRHPNLDWINEAQPIKQSASVILTMLLNWALALLPGVAYFLLGDRLPAGVFLAIYAVLLLILWALTDRWLKTKGVRILETLG